MVSAYRTRGITRWILTIGFAVCIVAVVDLWHQNQHMMMMEAAGRTTTSTTTQQEEPRLSANCECDGGDGHGKTQGLGDKEDTISSGSSSSSSSKGASSIASPGAIDNFDPLHFDDGDLPEGSLKAELKSREFFTLQDLKICKAAAGGPWGRRSMRCEKDESCLACTKPWHRAQASRLITAFSSETLAAERAQIITDSFPDRNAQPIVVTATNKAHFPYLVNWACGCRSHFSEDMRKQTLVLAADDETYAMARKSGFIAMPPSLFNVSPRHLDEEWAEKMNLTRNNVAKMGFPDSMAILVTCLTQLLEMKYTVITQDADVVWLKDVRHYLSSEKLRNVHLITQMAPRADAQGPVNTGFVYMRPAKITVVYMKSLIQSLPLFYMRVDDQVVWNTLLRHYLFRQLHIGVLPRKHFLDLHDHTAKWINGDTQFLHTVSNVKKIRRLRQHGEWHLTEACPWYEQEFEALFPEWDL
mmetsp:Transcript_43909/g.70593  ORF Transcript_43909/g.70593 Transcript_43909/m.70593 type:complete len:471 (+) Transcript_43909:55-1467(+)